MLSINSILQYINININNNNLNYNFSTSSFTALSAKINREIIKIDEDLCNGCGNCVVDCAEKALILVDTPNGKKARLVKENYCDGLGACIGNCPTGALTIEKRIAEDYDEIETEKHIQKLNQNNNNKKFIVKKKKHNPYHNPHGQFSSSSSSSSSSPCSSSSPSSPRKMPSGGCPGNMFVDLRKKKKENNEIIENNKINEDEGIENNENNNINNNNNNNSNNEIIEKQIKEPISELSHWPIQLNLINPSTPILEGSDVILCADCVPFAYPNFHEKFLKGEHPVMVACPKLDDNEPYVHKMKRIIENQKLNSLTILRMQVPCCGGLLNIVNQAMDQLIEELMEKKKFMRLPIIKQVIFSIDGKIIEEKQIN